MSAIPFSFAAAMIASERRAEAPSSPCARATLALSGNDRSRAPRGGVVRGGPTPPPPTRFVPRRTPSRFPSPRQPPRGGRERRPANGERLRGFVGSLGRSARGASPVPTRPTRRRHRRRQLPTRGQRGQVRERAARRAVFRRARRLGGPGSAFASQGSVAPLRRLGHPTGHPRARRALAWGGTRWRSRAPSSPLRTRLPERLSPLGNWHPRQDSNLEPSD